MAIAPFLRRTMMADAPDDRQGAGLAVVLNTYRNFDGRITLLEPKLDPIEFPPLIPPTVSRSR
jgi:hypothetical protein